MRYLILIFVLFIYKGNLQAQIKFYAQSDAKEILETSYVEVEFVLENADGENFKPPKFTNFRIIAGPNRSSSMSIVNGKMSKKLSYGYTLKPESANKLTIIGAATIDTYAGKLSTEAFTIKVVKASERQEQRSENVFIETICSDSIAFVGQQITLSYKLYTKLDVRSFNIESTQDYIGFYSEQLNTDREPTKREIINGTEYATKVIKRIALFPQQRGSYTIDPTVVSLGIATERNSRRFFFSSQLENKRLITKGVKIDVRNTPEPAPYSFSGAVGDYRMRCNLEKRTITTDDAITVKMEVIGDGDNKTVLAPIWMENDSFDLYDPNIIKDSLFVRSGRRWHKKVFEYLIVPKYSGRFQLSPQFSFFNTDSMDYMNLSKKLPPISVINGSGNATVSQQKSRINTNLISDTSLTKGPHRIHGKLVHLLMIGFLFIGIVGVIAYAQYLEKSGKKDPAFLLKEKALRKAMERLRDLDNLKTEKNSKFFEELTRALKQFIQDKYSIPALHIGKHEIIEKLKSLTVLTSEQLNSFESLLSDAEKALYAPGLVESPEQLYDRSLKLLTELES